MKALRPSSPGLVWLLLAGALLLRAAMPTGWMPTTDETGFRILLCSGSGPVETATAELKERLQAGHAQQNDGNDTPRDPCPFGLALSQALAMPAAPVADLPPEAVAALDGPAPVTARLVARRSLRPPARGPPSFA